MLASTDLIIVLGALHNFILLNTSEAKLNKQDPKKKPKKRKFVHILLLLIRSHTLVYEQNSRLQSIVLSVGPHSEQIRKPGLKIARASSAHINSWGPKVRYSQYFKMVQSGLISVTVIAISYLATVTLGKGKFG